MCIIVSSGVGGGTICEMEFEKAFFEYKDVRTVYYTAGEGSPLLFFHGGGAFAMAYEDTLAELAKDFFVIAPDLPCFGESSVPDAPWDFSDYADYFFHFLADLRLSNVLVIGHSFGGGVALHLAVRNELVSKLVLIDALCMRVSEPFGKLLRRVVLNDAKILLEKEVPEEVVEGYVRTNLPKTKEIGKIVKTVKSCVENADLDLKNYSKPTLIIWADGDKTLPLSYGRKISSEIPGSKLKVVPGNHFYCINNPQKVASYIRKFPTN